MKDPLFPTRRRWNASTASSAHVGDSPSYPLRATEKNPDGDVVSIALVRNGQETAVGLDGLTKKPGAINAKHVFYEA